MKATQLRQSILQAAVQGKLVPQNVHDEPATELFARIRQEKTRLIKEGKIKKEKPLPPIAEDEIPYDLPDGWIWCRLGELGETNIGLTYKPADISFQGTPVMRSNNIQNGKMNYDEVIHVKSAIPNKAMLKQGDILICARNGSRRLVGKTAIVDREGMAFGAFMAMFRCNCNDYINIYLSSPLFRANMDNPQTTTINQITQEMLKSTMFPLPPLAEQQRIVAKVDELMTLCDELEAAEKKLDTLEKRFAEYLPKSILQAAVQGKLVPQNVHDEPASELLSRIRTEKARIVKEGKIKKEKPLPPIAEDEIPYDLPDGWVWCRANDVCTYIQRGKSPIYSEIEKYPVLSQKCVQWSGIDMSKIKFIAPESLKKYEEMRFLRTDDLLWNSTGQGTLGRIMFYDEAVNKYENAVVDSHVTVMRPYKNHTLSQYLFYWFAGPMVQGEIELKATGSTKQIELATETIRNWHIPLPPLAEQQRIVAKVDELMALCDELKTAYTLPVKPPISNVVPFPQKDEEETDIGIAARGDGEELPPEAIADIAKLFGDDENV